MHGTLNDNTPEGKGLRGLRALVAGAEQLAHDLLALPIWRIALTFISFTTTTYGLMLLYDTLGGSHGQGSIGFLRYVIPVGVGGALHAAIYNLLTNWVTTRRRKFLSLAVALQIVAILASFGTHWVHMRAGDATTHAYVQIETLAEQGIRASAVSYNTVATNMSSLAQYSEAQARIEEMDHGTSCGVTAGSGQGPRYHLRMADRTTFAGFNTDVAERKTKIDKMVDEVSALTAGSPDEAMTRLPKLRSLVNEAKAEIESDPLLDQIRKAAEARILLGKGPIAIEPALRGRSRERQFTCYDAELQRRLNAVIDAIKSVKPLPDVVVPDYRNPTTGFPYALGRLFQAIAFDFSLPSRERLTADRVRTIRSTNASGDAQRWSDITPLAVASAIEILLTLLFYLARDTFSRHPAMAEFEKVVAREDPAVFDRIWYALGGSANPQAVQHALDAYSKFEGRYAWVLVPLYGEDREVKTLHRVMELMTEAGMARRVFTGRGLMARWYMRGWDPARRAQMAEQAVRIYRLSATEYLAFTLDALNRPHQQESFGDAPSEIYDRPAGTASSVGSTQRQQHPAKDDTDFPAAA